jgi:hypothetical protein
VHIITPFAKGTNRQFLKKKVSMIHDENNQSVGETKSTDSFTATLHLFILL